MWMRVCSVCVAAGVMTWGMSASRAEACLTEAQGRIVRGIESGFALGRVAPDWDYVPASAWPRPQEAPGRRDSREGREGVGRPAVMVEPADRVEQIPQVEEVEEIGRAAAVERTMTPDQEDRALPSDGGQRDKGTKSSGSENSEKSDKGDKSGKGEQAGKGAKGERRDEGGKAGAGGPVDLNSASVEQIEALPGIGPSLAARIVEYRQQQGPFKRVEDLMNVRGVGEKNFLKLKPLITVGAAKAER